MSFFLETDRLIARQAQSTDLQCYRTLLANLEVMHYVGKGAKSEIEIQKLLTRTMQHFAKHGFGLCTLFEKISGNFVGRAGLVYLAYDDSQPEIELGFAFLKGYWGKGYATEISQALIKWGFAHLPVERILGIVQPNNTNSRKVLEKTGMSFVQKAVYTEVNVDMFAIYKQSQTS